jgi:hypothetical protein
MTDHGRTAVYAAEVAAFEGTRFEAIVPFADLVDLAAIVLSAEWWPAGNVSIVPARRDSSTSSANLRGEVRTIRLAAPQMTPATVVHELAHVLAGVGRGHDGGFRRAHVDLTGHLLGDEAATWLIDGYASFGLDLSPRTWSAPPIRRAAGGPIAL